METNLFYSCDRWIKVALNPFERSNLEQGDFPRSSYNIWMNYILMVPGFHENFDVKHCLQ